MEHFLNVIVIVEHIEHTFDFCDHFGIVDINGVEGIISCSAERKV